MGVLQPSVLAYRFALREGPSAVPKGEDFVGSVILLLTAKVFAPREAPGSHPEGSQEVPSEPRERRG